MEALQGVENDSARKNHVLSSFKGGLQSVM